jgi:predicted  nucleic acid-binding Zn-ribbon protein
MAANKANFKCLRCGHIYQDNFTPGIVLERTCPKCASNSVRRLKDKPAA